MLYKETLNFDKANIRKRKLYFLKEPIDLINVDIDYYQLFHILFSLQNHIKIATLLMKLTTLKG